MRILILILFQCILDRSNFRYVTYICRIYKYMVYFRLIKVTRTILVNSRLIPLLQLTSDILSMDHKDRRRQSELNLPQIC